MRILKRICIIVMLMSVVLAGTAMADNETEDTVIVECPNLREALLVLTEDEYLNEDNLSELDGTVDLSNKGITSLKGIEYLTRTDKIILSNNNITDFTPLLSLEYIKEISVNLNEIETIPEGLSNLTNLKHLDISNNPIKALPNDINDCESLRWLCIDYCGIENIGSLNGLGDTLEWLVMPGNPQSDYSFLKDLPELELLNLNECNLTQVPDLTANPNLNYLYVANNQLTELPDYLAYYLMKRVDASYNYIDDIPDTWTNMSRMDQLVLTDNLFRQFPTEVLTYDRLKVFMMGYNLLTDVSPGLGVLKDLQRLSFTSNDFTSLATYSEFKIPYSYQLSFTYNRLNLDDEATQKILEDNHNTGGIQKDGSITANCTLATPQEIEININGAFDEFNELQNINYWAKEVIILDNADKSLLYVVDKCEMDGDDITVTIEDTFAENTTFDWEVILVMSIDTYPVINLKYISQASGEIKPITTPTPVPTPVPTDTPAASADSTFNPDNIDTAGKIMTLVIAGLLILAVIYVCILLIRNHNKKSKH